MATVIGRAGRFVKQPTGFGAFVPASLPPDPPVQVDAAMLSLLSRADQALGRLDGVTRNLPNPDFFVALYVRREAVLSSQIEGAQSTLEDVLKFELTRRVRLSPAKNGRRPRIAQNPSGERQVGSLLSLSSPY